jgi:hypothetical protein
MDRTHRRVCWSAAVVVAALLGSLSAAAAEPRIHLEWRPATVQATVGDAMAIGLYAVCSPGETQLLRAADVVFTWDPAVLRFDGIDNTVPGTAPNLSSTLPAGDPYGLNGPTLPPSDGDGYYRWWASLGQPVTVTDAGVRLTTFRFTALANAPATLVSIAPSGGSPVLQTRIFGSAEAGVIVTGTLGQCTVRVGGPDPLDLNDDGTVDVLDAFALMDCMNGPDVPEPPPGCDAATFERADLDTDDDVDLHDVATFQLLYSPL